MCVCSVCKFLFGKVRDLDLYDSLFETSSSHSSNSVYITVLFCNVWYIRVLSVWFPVSCGWSLFSHVESLLKEEDEDERWTWLDIWRHATEDTLMMRSPLLSSSEEEVTWTKMRCCCCAAAELDDPKGIMLLKEQSVQESKTFTNHDDDNMTCRCFRMKDPSLWCSSLPSKSSSLFLSIIRVMIISSLESRVWICLKSSSSSSRRWRF